MKKQNLMNGDIVVLRSGQIAVVVGQGKDAHLLFQQSGFEFLDDYYNDDMIYENNIDAVMQVFRPNGRFGFEGVNEEVPIYERDVTWVKPTEDKNKENSKEVISIISQAFYGNRTGTDIPRESIDRFIMGHMDDFAFDEPIDRTIVPLPGSNNLVLIYNKHQEARWLEKKARALREDNYVMSPLATIPEQSLEIYSRCIVCRMNAVGEFESLDAGDYEIWDRYLSF